MKKIFWIILIIFLFDNVYANNIIDNYYVDISINGTKVFINEEFDVLSVDQENSNFVKELFINHEDSTILTSNIQDFQIVDENADFPYFIGSIRPNESYKMEYFIDLNIVDAEPHDFFKCFMPDLTTINNLFFRVKYDNQISSVSIYEYDENLYEIVNDENENIITGRLVAPNDKAGFSIVGTLKEKNNEETNINANNSTKDVMSTTKIISIISLIISLGFGIMFYLSGYKTNAFLMIFHIVIVIGLVLLQLSLTSPWIILLAAFYSFFYSALFKAEESNILMWLILIVFLTFHSGFMFGFVIGIEAHIINNISIFICSFSYRNYRKLRK